MHDHDRGPVDDVRMRGFAHRHTVEAALAWLDRAIAAAGAPRLVPLRMAAGRVLATPVVSDVDVPGFDRATMDGYAVVAESTEGATSYNRLPLVGDRGLAAGTSLSRLGRSRPRRSNHDRRSAAARLRRRAARRVDRRRRRDEPLPSAPSPPCRPANMSAEHGEDIVRGTTLFQPGRVLRPQDLGVLSSVGVGEVPVFSRPRVRLVVTGNELLPSGSQPHGYRIADANGPMLAALVERDGGLVDFPGSGARRTRCRSSTRSKPTPMSSSCRVARASESRTSRRRWSRSTATWPSTGSPCGPAVRPVSGESGSGWCFCCPAIRCRASAPTISSPAGRFARWADATQAWPYRPIRARLTRKISSPIGRLDYARVSMVDGAVEPLAVGGASVLSSTTRADGFVIVPDDSEGFAPGTDVEVWLYA